MVKVAFPFHVLHGGRFCAPHEVLDVTESEASRLVGIGAKVLEMTPKELEKASTPVATEPQPVKRQYAKKKG